MIIAVVVDDDVINQIDFEGDNEALQEVYERELAWLNRRIQRAILTKKDYYPEKAKARGQPHVIWIVPPTNVNFNNNVKRRIFAEALKSTAEQFNDVTAYELKQVWDSEDMNLFLQPQNRFTSEGFIRYWDSIDRTLRYAHTVLFKNAKNAFRNIKNVQAKPEQGEKRPQNMTK